MQTNDMPNNIQWHPAFHGATRLEFRADISKLEVLPEFPLSKEPLSIDVLVIRKSADAQIENEVGRIFKGHIFREAYPRELFACFRKSGRTLVEKYPGVYYVTGNILFDAQVVVMSRLDRKVHKAYGILSRKTKEEDAKAFLNESRKYTTKAEKEDMKALLSVSVAANLEVYEKIRRDLKMSDVLEYLMRDVIAAREQKIVKEAERKIRRAEEKAAQAEKKSVQETKLTDIKNIMDSLKLTSEQAMNALQISPAEREIYLKRLEQQI